MCFGVFLKTVKLFSGDCVAFVKDLIVIHMGIDNGEAMDIERAHRSPPGKVANPTRRNPRPIHVKFLRYGDRERLLREAPKCLKNNEYRGNKIFLSDDVSKDVRMERKKLVRYRNQLRSEDKFAIIPWSVPACLLVKDNTGERGVLRRLTSANLPAALRSSASDDE